MEGLYPENEKAFGDLEPFYCEAQKGLYQHQLFLFKSEIFLLIHALYIAAC
jgi:hypothetical protein